jgi:hypothetical protein
MNLAARHGGTTFSGRSRTKFATRATNHEIEVSTNMHFKAHTSENPGDHDRFQWLYVIVHEGESMVYSARGWNAR